MRDPYLSVVAMVCQQLHVMISRHVAHGQRSPHPVDVHFTFLESQHLKLSIHRSQLTVLGLR
jgi:hypothetical protein